MATIIYALNNATGKVTKTVGKPKEAGQVRYQHDGPTGKVKAVKDA